MRRIKLYFNEYLNDYVNNLFLLVFPLVLLLMGFTKLIFFILYFAYLLIIYLRFNNKKIFYTVMVLSLVLSINYFINERIYDVNRYKYEEIDISGVITEKIEYDNEYNSYFRYQLKAKIDSHIFKKKILVYAKENFDIGDIVNVKGEIREIDGEKIEHGFNYENYLNKNKIYLVINSNKIDKIKSSLNINIIKKMVNEYFDKHFKGETLVLLRGLILGDTSGFSDEINEALKENGILHLFAVSGLHVSLFIALLTIVLSLFKMREKIIENIILIFLFMYLILTSFSISIVRASLMYLFSIINKRIFDKEFSSLDVVSFTFIVLVIINPYFAYSTGFILSFMVCFVIVLLSPLLVGKNNSYQILVISLISNAFTLPIIININYEYNLLTPVLNVLYINIVSLIVLPLSFITFIFPIFSYALDIISNVFLELVEFTSNINLKLRLPFFNSLYLIIFYGLMVALLIFFFNKRYKRIIYGLLLLFLVLISNIGYIRFTPEIDFLYLNDGDATLITIKNKVYLIDTGDGKNDEVYNSLKSRGIKNIEYLFITHCHNDHYGGVDKIISEINVRNVVTSELYNYSYHNQSRVRSGDIIEENGIRFYVLTPVKRYNEENDNCLTMLVSINNINVLFMADATIILEKDVAFKLDELGIKNIDIIKIGHHGSNSSTGYELLSSLKIDYAVIIVGKTRKMTHPSSDVIKRLNNYMIKYYVTTNNYSIKVKIRKNGRFDFYTLKD